MTLDLGAFRTVFSDDFSQDRSLSGLLWADRWGNPDQFNFGGGALTLTGSAAENWNPVGFMQAPVGRNAGEGYGLYQFSGYANAGQGIGICFIMWRADNVQLDPSTPNAATEIDVLESWDKSKTGESTIHYYNSSAAGGAALEYNHFSIDLTIPHTYAMDWELGSLTFYIDGRLIYQDMVHAPFDFADGGANEVMGAQILNERSLVTTPTVQLHITSMSYSSPNALSSAPQPPGGTGVTLSNGSQWYEAAAGSVVQVGAGNDTINAEAGETTVNGGTGRLIFFGGTGASSVSGGVGSLVAFGGTGGGNYMGGTQGPNVLVSQGASNTNTTLTGGAAGDQLFGSAQGNDKLVALHGRESVLGGGGPTTIVGGATAASVIFTGSGPTVVYGGIAGGDTIVGGTGSLSVVAQDGDTICGNSGALTVNGSAHGTGADSIIGGAGALSVTGDGGNMLVVAGTGNSQIATGNCWALIFGQSGNASITGGGGEMEIVQGSGNLTIQEGKDTAIYDIIKGSAGGSDVVNGFKPGSDQIRLFGYSHGDVQIARGPVSTLLTFTDGTRIQLAGVMDPKSSIVW